MEGFPPGSAEALGSLDGLKSFAVSVLTQALPPVDYVAKGRSFSVFRPQFLYL